MSAHLLFLATLYPPTFNGRLAKSSSPKTTKKAAQRTGRALEANERARVLARRELIFGQRRPGCARQVINATLSRPSPSSHRRGGTPWNKGLRIESPSNAASLASPREEL